MESAEASSPERLSPEEEDEEEAEAGRRGEGVSDYEKKRLSRIRENRARLEALGLPHLASSLLGPLAKHQSPNQEAAKNKRNKARNSKKKGDGSVGVDDDEYRPSDEDGEGELSASSSNDEEEEEEDYRPPSGSRRKGKKKSSNAAKVRKTSSVRGSTKEFDVADNDVALKQAILLSLGRASEDTGAVLGGLPHNSGSNATYTGSCGRKDRSNIKETAAKKNSRKGNKSRVQLTEDEVVAYFFSFDEAGKGNITFRDLQRIVTAHDFTWTDIEIANMIRSFDSDGDGKLSLGDFQTIVTRCNMLREPKEC